MRAIGLAAGPLGRIRTKKLPRSDLGNYSPRRQSTLESALLLPACERQILTITNYDVRSLYLDLLRRNLTRYGMRERMPSDWPLRRRLLLKTVNTIGPRLRGAGLRDQHMREAGLDWPAEAETMIGMKRLT